MDLIDRVLSRQARCKREQYNSTYKKPPKRQNWTMLFRSQDKEGEVVTLREAEVGFWDAGNFYFISCSGCRSHGKLTLCTHWDIKLSVYFSVSCSFLKKVYLVRSSENWIKWIQRFLLALKPWSWDETQTSPTIIEVRLMVGLETWQNEVYVLALFSSATWKCPSPWRSPFYPHWAPWCPETHTKKCKRPYRQSFGVMQFQKLPQGGKDDISWCF